MNFINKIFLKLVLLPAPLYRNMGVDIPRLASILHIKLVMDDRRPATWHQTRKRKQEKPVSLATVGTMVLSFLMGILYLFSFSVGANMITRLSIYFSLFFVMLSATLISDFTSVLVDIRDNYIILPKPVNDRTFLLARLLHIFIHICKIVLPMSLPGILYMAYNTGIAGSLLFALLVLFVTLFSIFFINALYIFILRITTPTKFQAIISYIQIVFAIIIYGGYQLLPRLINQSGLRDFDITVYRTAVLFPLYWFASAWKVLYTLQGTVSEWLAAVLGLVLPFLSLFVVVRYLAPSFNNKLALITSSSAEPVQAKKPGKKRNSSSYAGWLAGLFTRSGAERMGFLFTWKMTSRSRDFRMKVYPSIGYLVVYVFIIFFNDRHFNMEDIAEQGRSGQVIILSALYFTSFLLTMAINQIAYSEKYKASWIFYTSPLERPGEVILGATKAAILKFYIPIVLFLVIAGVYIAGPGILPNILLGLLNELLIATILVYIGSKLFPFSLHQNTRVKAGSFLRNMFVLLISVLIAMGHFIIYGIPAAVLLCILLSLMATWMMMGGIRRISWEAIRNRYEEE